MLRRLTRFTLPAVSLAVTVVTARSFMPAYLRAIFLGTFSLKANGFPAVTTRVTRLSLIGLALFRRADARARVGGVTLVLTVTVAPSPQFTVTTRHRITPPDTVAAWPAGTRTTFRIRVDASRS